MTYPHKLGVRKFLQRVSSSAERIGAINTIVLKDTKAGRVLLGDNIDWIGIKRCIERSGVSLQTAIVVGAGGAARAAVYAVQELRLTQSAPRQPYSRHGGEAGCKFSTYQISAL